MYVKKCISLPDAVCPNCALSVLNILAIKEERLTDGIEEDKATSFTDPLRAKWRSSS